MTHGSVTGLSEGAIVVLFPLESIWSEYGQGPWGWGERRKEGLIYHLDSREWYQINDNGEDYPGSGYALLDDEIREINYLVGYWNGW